MTPEDEQAMEWAHTFVGTEHHAKILGNAARAYRANAWKIARFDEIAERVKKGEMALVAVEPTRDMVTIGACYITRKDAYTNMIRAHGVDPLLTNEGEEK